jgi:hypothetical protein
MSLEEATEEDRHSSRCKMLVTSRDLLLRFLVEVKIETVTNMTRDNIMYSVFQKQFLTW